MRKLKSIVSKSLVLPILTFSSMPSYINQKVYAASEQNDKEIKDKISNFNSQLNDLIVGIFGKEKIDITLISKAVSLKDEKKAKEFAEELTKDEKKVNNVISMAENLVRNLIDEVVICQNEGVNIDIESIKSELIKSLESAISTFLNNTLGNFLPSNEILEKLPNRISKLLNEEVKVMDKKVMWDEMKDDQIFGVRLYIDSQPIDKNELDNCFCFHNNAENMQYFCGNSGNVAICFYAPKFDQIFEHFKLKVSMLFDVDIFIKRILYIFNSLRGIETKGYSDGLLSMVVGLLKSIGGVNAEVINKYLKKTEEALKKNEFDTEIISKLIRGNEEEKSVNQEVLKKFLESIINTSVQKLAERIDQLVVENQVHSGQEFKEPEVTSEPEVKESVEKSEVKSEQEIKESDEKSGVKSEPEIKEPEEKSEVNSKQEVKKLEVRSELEIKEPEANPELEIKESEEKPKTISEPEVKEPDGERVNRFTKGKKIVKFEAKKSKIINPIKNKTENGNSQKVPIEPTKFHPVEILYMTPALLAEFFAITFNTDCLSRFYNFVIDKQKFRDKNEKNVSNEQNSSIDEIISDDKKIN